MKRTPLALSLRTLPAVLAALGGLWSPLHAVERFWVTPAGGAFVTPGNWSATDGGAGGATVPVAGDIANFTLNSTYTTTIAANTTNLALDVENGNVTLDLGSSTYTLTSGGAVHIGKVFGQTGRLTVTDGILAVDTNSDSVIIGLVTGSTGFLTVTTGGRIGDGTIRPGVTVGSGGPGTLTVNDNGRIDASFFSVGNNAGVTGLATITGPNAVADIGSATIVGNGGTGSLSVLSGGTLTSTSTVTLGAFLGADGTASVGGIGSSWAMGSSCLIGSSGDGTLTVSAGGLATTVGTVTLGSASTGFGTATVTGAGSRWAMASTQVVGSNGLGVMTVSNGGEVTSSGVTLGALVPGEGRATVTGAGSHWTMQGSLASGVSGTGDFVVSAGGEVEMTGLLLGSVASGTGNVTVTGSGSRLTASSSVGVASLGSGTLNVASGAELYCETSLTVNDPAGAPVGTLNLDGGSVFVTGNFINNSVFNFTDGLLQVAGTFQPNATALGMTINGTDNGDLPTVDLIGTGTTTNVTGVTVGSNRRGELLLRQGRVLNLGNNTIALGSLAGGEGTLSVQSGAQLIATGFLEVGGTSGGIAAGTGTLNITGGTVDVATLELFRDGTVNLSSGTLAVDTAPVLDGQFHWTGGTLRFDTAFALTSTNVPKLLGLDATLNAGQALTSTATVTLQTPLIVDGGVLSASNLINQSRLEVRSGFLGNVQNDGLLLGDGLITGTVTNTATGRIRVDAGDTLSFTGTIAPNAGQVTLQGGSIEYGGNFTNSATGFINGRGAIFGGSVTNNGQMAFSGGTMDLFGDALLNAGSRVATSGAGSVTTFWDDVLHNGTEIFTGVNCSTVFYGSQSGAGPFTGTGTIYFIGDLRPGNSPAAVTYAPQVIFAPSTALTLEIGGLTAGTQHDKLTFTHAATPQVEWGGALTVTLINGFTPAAGQSFDVLDFDAARDAGAFSSVTLPVLTVGLAWDISQLYTTGTITVVSSTGVTFAQWASANGIPGALPGGDHDGDGIANGVEFALGLFPNQPGTVAPVIDLFPYAGGNRLRTRFTRPLDRTGVTLVVQASADLQTWTDVATSVNSAPFTGAGFVSENRAHPLTDPGLVETRDIFTTATNPRRQVRVKVTIAP